MNAIDLHKKAESARESENFLDALTYCDQALIEYQKEGNIQGFAQVLCSRVITLRHLFEQTGHQGYLILAKHTAKASVEIARKGNDPKALAIPLFNLANVLDVLGELGEAIENYKQAIAHMRENPPQDHNRPSVIYDMTLHLFVCEYKNGDKSALQKAEKALLDLAASKEPDKYTKDVWMSGGYLKIAQMLKDDDPTKAKQALEKARKIINANPSLTLRKKQLDKISASF
ncbi:MAG: hypothetical protein UR81_C0001G0030 [Candidatus Levybacteria bacterium GW2011_GWB1_35_5]|nr:MAG: hypothetical protein UR81_C0001G0030 [Candidatus Levybacteria bacterium GW2011_GWB1_35_5]